MKRSEIFKALTKKHDVLLQVIGNKSCQYIDVPLYDNMGDHLIAHGTFKYFEKNQIKPVRISRLNEYKNKWIDESQLLIFSGGGNFGDLWPEIHESRIKIIDKALSLGKTIIILPQSIWYDSKLNYLNDIARFKGVENLHLCVRDHQSLHIGSEISEKIYLLPDMAHHLHLDLMIKRNFVTKNSLYFFRRDKEKNKKYLDVYYKNISYDWGDILEYKNSFIYMKLIKKWYKFIDKIYLSDFIDKDMIVWRKLSWEMVENLAQFFTQYDCVYTDRLHGMIFASMLGLKCKVFDNSYGKVIGYKDCWLKGGLD